MEKNFIKLCMSFLIIILISFLGAISLQGCNVDDGLETFDSVDDVSKTNVGISFDWEQRFTEENQRKLVKASPPPKLDTSLERDNLIKRYEFLNDENKIFYVYLVSYGKVMAYYTAQGKISSVNSRLTQEEQVIDVDRLDIDSHQANDAVIVGSPQLDGSYGTNGDGIFFFTTEGAYVEWNGEYMVSDFPLRLSTPPQLIKEVN